MKTLSALLLLSAILFTPALAQKAKKDKLSTPKLLKCGDSIPYQKVGDGEIFFNGKPLQLTFAGCWDKNGVRYIRFDISPSDTTLPLGQGVMPGMYLGVSFPIDQKPGAMTISYYIDPKQPLEAATIFVTGDQYVEAHGYAALAGHESTLQVALTTNDRKRCVGRFHLQGKENPKHNFPQCVIDGTFDSTLITKLP